MLEKVKSYYYSFRKKQRIATYLKNGRIPWSEGYDDFKWNQIEKVLHDSSIKESFLSGNLPDNYGIGIDERIVEYPWIMTNIDPESKKVLDAGSILNHKTLLDVDLIRNKELTIVTLSPEQVNFNERGISYVYGDLRSLPFMDNFFEVIVCQSTIEHIDMDNSMYGYDGENKLLSGGKNYEYLKAVEELSRTIQNHGTILLTFPYGKFENHGFFQQLDMEMTERILKIFRQSGETKLDFFKYTTQGWQYGKQKECNDSISYNPHSGLGKNDDGAAHCRAICCIKFVKK